ncbi:hypothetical protein HK104_007895, partial [Borealophlyctis nickersoniae]
MYNPLTPLKRLTKTYGPTYILTTQLVSLLTFLLIYFCLRLSPLSPPALLRAVGVTNETVTRAAEKGGNLAVAFALNKVLGP